MTMLKICAFFCSIIPDSHWTSHSHQVIESPADIDTDVTIRWIIEIRKQRYSIQFKHYASILSYKEVNKYCNTTRQLIVTIPVGPSMNYQLIR